MGLDARHDDRCHARSCVPSGETSAACRIRVRAVEYFMHVTPEFPDDIAMVGLPAFLNVLSYHLLLYSMDCFLLFLLYNLDTISSRARCNFASAFKNIL